MNRLCCLLLLVSTCATAQTPGYQIRYANNTLRIPGKKFAIALLSPDGKPLSWGKYHVKVDSGRLAGGYIQVDKSSMFKKGDSLTVSVYTRKWLLGGRGKFVTSRRIPYDYEDSITILTNGNASLSPGDHVQFGIRTVYDNGQFLEDWHAATKKSFQFQFDGGRLSKSKGDLKIESDPSVIKNDRIGIEARLAKFPAIADSLQLLLDYKASFTCTIRSVNDGHDLDVFADVLRDSTIQESLLKIDVRDSATGRVYHYLVNTAGGSLTLTSRAADGAPGMNGFDGQSGANGSDGAVTTTPETTTNPDGTTSTTYTATQGAGSDGSDGGPGDDGKNGGDGFAGGDIRIRYTQAAAPFLSLIKATSPGGNGGSGGRGGTGGSGGAGGIGNPSGRSGLKGRDGNNGWEGNAGKPGTVRWNIIP